MLDLLIDGGFVVSPTGLERKALGLKDGRIAAILDPGEPASAAATIDVEGMLLLPGLVDAHVHFREPGLTHKEDFASGGRAAAAGGVTTVMVMPTDDPMTTTPDLFLEKKELAEGACHVDYALQAGLGPDTQYVRTLADLGAVSFEAFLADLKAPMLTDRMIDLLVCLVAVRDVGGVLGVSPGEDTVTLALAAAAQANDPTDRLGFARSRPPIAEAVGVARACIGASETGTKAHIRQVSCARSVEILRKLAPENLSAEATPHNLLLNELELVRQGPVAKVAPPLRAQSDLVAVQKALRDGVIQIVATDHAPHLPEEKHAGDVDIWKAPGGFPGVQSFLPLMLRMVGDGLMTYPELIRVCCEAPARLFGLYPQKGALAVGADADIVVIDTRRPFTIRNEEQESKARLTPFDKWTSPATPALVLLRGKVIMRDGRPLGPALGRFVRPNG